MVSPAPSPRRKRLGELLLDAGVLSDAQLQAALVEQKKWGGKLGRTVVELGFVREEAMVAALSQQLKLPTVDLAKARLPPTVVQLLRVDFAERYGVFPLAGDARAHTLTLATSDPTNVEAIAALEELTDARITLHVTTGSQIDRAIRQHYYGEAAAPPVAAPAPEPGVVEAEKPRLSFDPEALVADARPGVSGQPRPAGEALLREVAVLRERLDAMERVSASNVHALRALVELLIHSGLISREEYLARVHHTG